MRLARIGIRRPSSQLGPALRLTTGRDNFYSEIHRKYQLVLSYFGGTPPYMSARAVNLNYIG